MELMQPCQIRMGKKWKKPLSLKPAAHYWRVLWQIRLSFQWSNSTEVWEIACEEDLVKPLALCFVHWSWLLSRNCWGYKVPMDSTSTVPQILGLLGDGVISCSWPLGKLVRGWWSWSLEGTSINFHLSLFRLKKSRWEFKDFPTALKPCKLWHFQSFCRCQYLNSGKSSSTISTPVSGILMLQFASCEISILTNYSLEKPFAILGPSIASTMCTFAAKAFSGFREVDRF